MDLILSPTASRVTFYNYTVSNKAPVIKQGRLRERGPALNLTFRI